MDSDGKMTQINSVQNAQVNPGIFRRLKTELEGQQKTC